MYRELQPLRQALSAELKADLPPAPPGIEAEHLLQSDVAQHRVRSPDSYQSSSR